MKRFALALSTAAALLGAPSARAQTTATTTIYSAVDAVAVQYNRLTITGVVRGEAVASTRTFALTSNSRDPIDGAILQSCARLAALAMEKPGAYYFQVTPYLSSYTNGCALSRVTP